MMDKAKTLLISGIIGISISLSMCMPISITAVAAYPYPYPTNPYDGMIRYWHPSMPYYSGINPWLGLGVGLGAGTGGWPIPNDIIYPGQIYPSQGMPLTPMPPVISVPMPMPIIPSPNPSPVIPAPAPAPAMPGPVIPGGTVGQQQQHSTQTCNPPGSCTRNDMIGGDHFIQSGHVNNFGP